MLDCPGDTHRDVQVGCDDLAGLADLHVVGHEARIDCRPGCADGGTQFIGNALQQFEVLAILHAATTGNDHARGRQLGAIGNRHFFADESGQARVVYRVNRFHRGRTAVGRSGIEGSGAHGDHFLRVTALHRGDHVAGVDRALEGVCRFHRCDLGNLGHVQQSRHARHDVLAAGRRRRHDVVVSGTDLGDQQADVFGQLVFVRGIVRYQYLADTADFGRFLGDSATAGASHQNVDIRAQGLGRGDRVEGCNLEAAVVVFCNYQCAHWITFASFFSLSTSSATSATLMPAWRSAGGWTFTWVRCEVTVTPRSSGV